MEIVLRDYSAHFLNFCWDGRKASNSVTSLNDIVAQWLNWVPSGALLVQLQIPIHQYLPDPAIPTSEANHLKLFLFPPRTVESARERQFFSNYPTSPDIRIDYCNLN